MLNDTDTRYDAEPTQTIIGPEDPQPAPAIVTQTAAQLAKLANQEMDPAPAPKKTGKAKSAAAKVPGKAKPEPLYAVLDMEAHTYRFVTVADLQSVARQIEGQQYQILYRLVPQVVNINVEITE